LTEFIFGTLSTMELRTQQLRSLTRAVRHLHRLDPLAPQAGEEPTVFITIGLDQVIEKVICEILEPERVSIPLHLLDTKWDTLNWAYYQTWDARLPSRSDGVVVRYTVQAFPQDGGPPIPADNGASFSYLVGDPRPPAWAEQAVIYQLLPDRFHPGGGRSWNQPDSVDGIYGGSIKGITQHLDHISILGFNCIWLNPFFPDHTHHGYHATDYFRVNPRLGSSSDLRDLVEQAHARGIRLLLDFVANHWGSGHPTFQAAVNDKNSEYYHWYHWNKWPDDYDMFFNVKDLPQINLDHPPARRHLLDAAEFWLSEFGFDGFRLDYALGPSHDFWTDFAATTRRANPEVWTIGEVVETPLTQLSYWGRLHGCLDFLLQQALRYTFALGKMTLSAFDAFLNQHETFFPPGFSRPSFLDNHDLNRFLWLAKGDKRKLKLAALCQFTLAGPPIVYYGTEIGLSQDRDVVNEAGRHIMAESRLPMIWDDRQDVDLMEYYRRLIEFRRAHPALWRGSRKTILLNEAEGVYVYSRQDEYEKIIVAFNLSHRQQDFEVAGFRFSLAPWSGDTAVSRTI
jgi:glycosidase